MDPKVNTKTTTAQTEQKTQPTTPKQNGDDTAKLPPSLDLMIDLAKTPYTQDIRTYHRLINQIDWTLADAEVLDKALDVTIAFVDMKKTKELATIGRERFPDHQGIAGAWKLVNPPPAKFVKTTRYRKSPESFWATAKWLDDHIFDYEVGHWLAVRNGQLVADASTLEELNNILKARNEDYTQVEPPLVHKVIA